MPVSRGPSWNRAGRSDMLTERDTVSLECLGCRQSNSTSGPARPPGILAQAAPASRLPHSSTIESDPMSRTTWIGLGLLLAVIATDATPAKADVSLPNIF